MRFAFYLLIVLAAARLNAQAPRPIILDTDIGTDVDDAYALVLAARSPELDLRAVTTVNGKVDVRAAIARKLLLLMDRGEVPVAAGRSRPDDNHEHFWGGWEGNGLLEEGETVEGVSELPAAELMAQVLRDSPRPVTIVPVGGLSNVADLLRKFPESKSKIERVVIMGGCVRPLVIDGVQLPERLETNLHNDVESAVTVLESGLPITLTPAEVTFRARLLAADFHHIAAAESPLAGAMERMTAVFDPLLKQFMRQLGVQTFNERDSILLHDPLALFTLIEPESVTMVRTTIRVEVGQGTIRTLADEAGPITVDLVTDARLERLSEAVAQAVLGEREAR